MHEEVHALKDDSTVRRAVMTSEACLNKPTTIKRLAPYRKSPTSTMQPGDVPPKFKHITVVFGAFNIDLMQSEIVARRSYPELAT
ncbi:hypothetical protein [Burkholderia cenocepacia]|uniref:hypothetical protein n=1 Tax=Burkholderia cenocepacia TaxID=95486 RepID=UPI002AB06F36|nr:hypothetical protein [Burkholderia cenocepacia]